MLEWITKAGNYEEVLQNDTLFKLYEKQIDEEIIAYISYSPYDSLYMFWVDSIINRDKIKIKSKQHLKYLEKQALSTYYKLGINGIIGFNGEFYPCDVMGHSTLAHTIRHNGPHIYCRKYDLEAWKPVSKNQFETAMQWCIDNLYKLENVASGTGWAKYIQDTPIKVVSRGLQKGT